VLEFSVLVGVRGGAGALFAGFMLLAFVIWSGLRVRGGLVICRSVRPIGAGFLSGNFTVFDKK
jgi:hypothetical protein